MFDKLHYSTCRRGQEVISYLYREMTAAETESFESHLATCGRCVDELAAISEPHLAVYEWRTNVFDKIPAPSIGLPLDSSEQPRSAGFLDRLSALLAGWPIGLKVGIGFAAFLLVGFSVFFLIRPGAPPEVAKAINVAGPQADELAADKNLTLPAPSDDSTVIVTPAAGDKEENLSESRRNTKVVRVKDTEQVTRKSSARRAGRTEFASTRQEKSTTQKSLRLNNFEEEDDTSLRLADLFEEVGSLY